jgi:DNA gyrase subunit A
MIDNPDITLAELIQHIPGPDFPTAGIINGSRGIHEAYLTGRGRIYVRARARIEEDGDKSSIIVTELPYQVNKARLLEKIAELVKDKKLTGIRELRDESDKDGMRMVIELRKGESGDIILNNLYQHTQMQSVFGINMVALVDGQPRLLNLKILLEAFIKHRREIVTRRTVFDLKKARARAHVLEGLAVALANIDPVIELIKASKTPAEAGLLQPVWQSTVVEQMLQRAGAEASKPDDLPPELGLIDGGYRLSEIQAQAILDLKLQRLTGLEQDKVLTEYSEILEAIKELRDILARPERLMQVIRDELVSIQQRYGDERRTEIVETQEDLSIEDLINEEDVVVTLSHAGYAKYQSIDTYRSQRRGGRGKSATNVKEEDFVDKLFIASTHDTMLCFSSLGKLYWLKVYQLPQASRTARGKPIINLLPLDEGERISAIVPIREFTEDYFLFMATADGTVKKCSLKDFSRPRPSGIRAIELVEGNHLVGVEVTDGQHDVMLFSDGGKCVRFNEADVRPMGRTARGVRGIRLGEGQKVISLLIVESEDVSVLTATEHGYGKRTPISDYARKARGGVGVISIQTTERNGRVIGAEAVDEADEIMLISNLGTLIRTPARDVSTMGRNTQGVRLVTLAEGELLSNIERIVEDSEEEEEEPSV